MNHACDPIDSKYRDTQAMAEDADAMVEEIERLIASSKACDGPPERRGRDRFPIPYTFRLTPVNDSGQVILDDTTTVVGRDLSVGGISFSHDHTLRHRRAVVSLDHPKVGRFAVEAEILWTRPTPLGLFESGCRLIRTVDGHILRDGTGGDGEFPNDE